MSNEKEFVYVASFDIGKKNFCFCIEKFDKKSIEVIPKLDKNNRYNDDGTTNDTFSKIVKTICKNGEIILFKNSDLTTNCDKTKYLDTNSFHNMTDLLDNYKDYWRQCDYILIEQQVSFGKKYNTMALKLGQHAFSYFAINYGRFKSIIEYPAYFKTQVLGAQKIKKTSKAGKITYKAIDKPARKKWAIEKGTSILTERNDLETLASITSMGKKDDFFDCLLMIESMKILHFWSQDITFL
jgi:hypothetical protein